MDDGQPLADLAWPPPLLRAQPGLPRLRSQRVLSRGFSRGQSMKFLQTPPAAAAWNMALDEALLLFVSSIGEPIFRSYSWTEPAATFGYFQKYADIAAWTNL